MKKKVFLPSPHSYPPKSLISVWLQAMLSEFWLWDSVDAVDHVDSRANIKCEVHKGAIDKSLGKRKKKRLICIYLWSLNGIKPIQELIQETSEDKLGCLMLADKLQKIYCNVHGVTGVLLPVCSLVEWTNYFFVKPRQIRECSVWPLELGPLQRYHVRCGIQKPTPEPLSHSDCTYCTCVALYLKTSNSVPTSSTRTTILDTPLRWMRTTRSTVL